MRWKRYDSFSPWILCSYVFSAQPTVNNMNIYLHRRLSLRSTTRLFTTALTPNGHLSNSRSPITSQLSFVNNVTGDKSQIPSFRILDGAGKVIEGAQEPDVSLSGFSTIRLFSDHCFALE